MFLHHTHFFYLSSRANKQLRFHLRCLDDGRPHPLAHDSAITYHLATVDVLEAWHVVQIYTDYVAIMLVASSELSELIVWNWRTGEQKAVCPPHLSISPFIVHP